jgi:hypothetical protein
VDLNLRRANEILPDSNQPAPEVCNSRSLGSKANTPDADKEKRNDSEIEDGETGQDQIITSADADGISANHVKSGNKRTQEANLTLNKKLLHELRLQFGSEDETDKATEKKEKKGNKEKKKVTQTRARTR